MCPICWISGFVAAIFGGSLLAVVNHPISWILSGLLIAYAAFKFYEAKQKGNKMTKAKNIIPNKVIKSKIIFSDTKSSFK